MITGRWLNRGRVSVVWREARRRESRRRWGKRAGKRPRI